VEFGPGRPKYVQVADDMRRRIASGEWRIGQTLPDLLDLEKEYGCSFGTVRAGEQILVGEGLLAQPQQGIPTRVIKTPDAPGLREALARVREAHRQLDEALADLERAAA
jgi:DNA-binding GntR family transcriptional regulator